MFRSLIKVKGKLDTAAIRHAQNTTVQRFYYMHTVEIHKWERLCITICIHIYIFLRGENSRSVISSTKQRNTKKKLQKN